MAVIVLAAPVVGLVVGLVIGDRMEEAVVLKLVGVALDVGELHRRLALEGDYGLAAITEEVGLSQRPFGGLRSASGIGDLPCEIEQFDAAGIVELDGVVIEDLPIVAADADLPAAHALRLQRMRLHQPIDYVERVDVLLDHVVAAGPKEEVPVADLIFGFQFRRAGGDVTQGRRYWCIPQAQQSSPKIFVNLSHGVAVSNTY